MTRAPSTLLPSLATLCALLGAAACGPGVRGTDLGTAAAHVESPNGRSLNGRSLNGRSLNGTDLSSAIVTGIELAGATLGGLPLGSVAVTGGTISASLGGAPLSGEQLTGSFWQAALSTGRTLPLRVDAVARLAAPNADLFGFALSYDTTLGPQRLCGDEPDGSPILATALPGLFNYSSGSLLGVGALSAGGSYSSSSSQFTFACRHHAIAKCVELGYKPWLSRSGRSLAPYLAACTRTLRADYCGDGTSYTIDGTLIDLYDSLGVQLDTEAAWPFEAEWNANGARCIAPSAVDRFTNTGVTPPCFAAKRLLGCGLGFLAPDALIIDRYKR